ncbi:MAG: calcium-binding protein, partial [Mariniblastus sp.]
MKNLNWISKVRKSLVGTPSRNLRRRHRRTVSTFESLEPRNLLASISFDAGVGSLSFVADAGQADAVTVSAPTATSLRIQVGNGDSISLQDDASGNAAFVLSATSVADDTLTIDVASAMVSSLMFELLDLDDLFTVTGLAGIADLSVLGGDGNDTLDASAVSTGVQFFGGDGNDVLIGSGGVDTINGGADNDTITGGLGADLQFGDAGDDLFIWNNGDGPDDNTGGADNDTFTFNGADGADDILSLMAGPGDGSLVGAAFNLTRTAPSAFAIEGVEIE